MTYLGLDLLRYFEIVIFKCPDVECTSCLTYNSTALRGICTSCLPLYKLVDELCVKVCGDGV